MPISTLYYVPETPTHPPPSATLFETLHKTLHPTGPFRITHSLSRHTSTPQILQHLTHPSLPPSTPHYFLITSPSSPPADSTGVPAASPGFTSTSLTTTSTFPQLLKTHLSGLWTLRQTLRVDGICFEDDGGEFRVRVGRVLRGEVVRGCVVEVEYRATGWGEGTAVAREWLEGLGVVGGRWIETEVGEEREWGVGDTARGWCELLRTR